MLKVTNVLVAVMVLLLAVCSASARQAKDLQTFLGIKTIDIETISGNCTIRAAEDNKVTVEVRNEVDPPQSFQPEIRQSDSGLRIKENWNGSSSGKVHWSIWVPEGVEIDYESASGDLDIEGIVNDIEASTASGEISIADTNGEVEIKTASGDVNLRDSRGEFEISTASGEIVAENLEGEIEFQTASGDIELKNSKGLFDIRCASGEIEVQEVVMDGDASFSTASGDVDVRLKEVVPHELELSSASGNVTLDLNGNKLSGRMQAEFRPGKGKVNIPFQSVKEETFTRNGQEYTRITYGNGKDEPVYRLNTASGRVTVVK